MTLISPDGDVIVTNDGATILEKMEVKSIPYLISIITRFNTKSPDY